MQDFVQRKQNATKDFLLLLFIFLPVRLKINTFFPFIITILENDMLYVYYSNNCP